MQFKPSYPPRVAWQPQPPYVPITRQPRVPIQRTPVFPISGSISGTASVPYKTITIDRMPTRNPIPETDGMKSEENLKEICDRFLRKQMDDKKLYQSIDDASSQFTKFIAQKVSSAAGYALSETQSSSLRNKTISNIYMMVMYLIATLKICDLETRLFPLIFGDTVGSVADLVYKGALTLSAMKIFDVTTVSFNITIPNIDDALKLYGVDPFTNIKGGKKKQKGGYNGVITSFTDKQLLTIHDNMRTNLIALWDNIYTN